MGGARGRPLRRRHLRHRLERCLDRALHGVQGIFYGDPGQLGAQIIDMVVGFIWAWGVMWLLFRIAMRFIKTRVDPEVEIEGLDEGEFGRCATRTS